MKENIKVSIVCVSYNHEKYLSQCIESFLQQECNFDYEILIHDDASKDGSQQIIKGFHDKHPDLIKPILQTENQFSKGIKIWPQILFPKAQGKYIALCEGDDYWTDPLKLQKQVDFMENNPDYALCCHSYDRVSQNDEVIKKNQFEEFLQKHPQGYTFDANSYMGKFVVQTATVLFLKNALQKDIQLKYKYFRDKSLYYEILKKDNKKGFLMPINAANYRIHERGVYSGLDEIALLATHYNVNYEIFYKNRKHLKENKNLRKNLNNQNIKLLKHYTQVKDKTKVNRLLRQSFFLLDMSKFLNRVKSFYF